jgi:hypothetical protein
VVVAADAGWLVVGADAGWWWCMWGLYFLLFSKMFVMRQQWCTTVFNSFHG